MMPKSWLIMLVGLLVPHGVEAASSIVTTQPVQGVPYNAAPIRSNFGAAAADINALQNMNAGPVAPASPTLGMLWLNTPQSATLYTLNVWNNRQNQWLPIASLDSLNNLWITNVGGGLPVTLAGADTIDLGAVPQAVVTITGGGPVFSFGSSAPAGIVKFLSFTGVTTLTYNATSLILPGATNLTTAAGDMAIATSLGSGNWQVMYYSAAGLIVAKGGTGQTTLTAHAVLVGEGGSPVAMVGPGNLGYPLLAQGSTTDPYFGQLDLGIAATGINSVSHGGTGLSSMAAHYLPIGNGTSALSLVAPGTIAYPLVSRGPTIDPGYSLLTVPGGGTGAAALTAHSVLIGEGVGSVVGVTYAVSGYPLLSTGASTDPAFGAVFSGVATAASSNNPLYFSTFTQQTAYAFLLPLSGVIGDTVRSFQDTIYVQSIDSDITLYARHHQNNAGRFAAFGPYSGGLWQSGSKSIVGAFSYALGATIGVPLTDGNYPGIVGMVADSFQYGAGLSTNEFGCHNPSAADGSIAQALTLACVQAILDNSRDEANFTTHTAYAFLGTNIGTKRATALLGASGTGEYINWLDGGSAVVFANAILMPRGKADATCVDPGGSQAAARINYGANNGNPAGGSYTDWRCAIAGGQYRWVDAGVVIGTLSTLGLGINTTAGSGGVIVQPVSGTGAGGFSAVGNWVTGLDLSSATITGSGIAMPNTTPGSVISYEADNYTYYAASKYFVVMANIPALGVDATGVTITGLLNTTGLYYAAGTPGVTCAGAPTAGFASINGIVTAC